MNNNKLPVVSIFLEAISLPYKYYQLLFKVGWPLIFSGGLIILFNHFNSEDASQFTISSISISAIFLIPLVMAIVGCHRIFLMDQNIVKNTKFLNWTGNELKYAGWWILIGVCVMIIAIPFMLLFIPFLNSTLHTIYESDTLLYILMGVFNLPLYYIASRWSLILPSSAIDRHGKTLLWSWELSNNNGWRLTLLIGVIPFVSEAVFSLLPTQDSIIYTLLYGVMWLIVGVIEIGLLSLSYAFFTSNSHNEIAEDI